MSDSKPRQLQVYLQGIPDPFKFLLPDEEIELFQNLIQSRLADPSADALFTLHDKVRTTSIRLDAVIAYTISPQREIKAV